MNANNSEYTFQQAISRARAREAAELAEIIAGTRVVERSRDIGEMLREQAQARMVKALS